MAVYAFNNSIAQKLGEHSLISNVTKLPQPVASIWLSLCEMRFSNKIITSLSMFYAHTDYKSKSSNVGNGDEVIFDLTEGEWAAVQIPYLEGSYKPSQSRKLIIFLGAGGPSTDNFVKVYQPDAAALIFPSPSINSDVANHVGANAQVLKSQFRIDDEEIIKVPPFSVLKATEVSLKLLSISKADDVSLISLGTKPHSISAAIACMLSNEATLVCRSPKKYRHSEGNPTGISSLYVVEDLSNPGRLIDVPLAL